MRYFGIAAVALAFSSLPAFADVTLSLGEKLTRNGTTYTITQLGDKADCRPSVSAYSFSPYDDQFGPTVQALTCQQKQNIKIIGDAVNLFFAIASPFTAYCAQPHLAVGFGVAGALTQMAMITVENMPCELMKDKDKAAQELCEVLKERGIPCNPKKAEVLIKMIGD